MGTVAAALVHPWQGLVAQRARTAQGRRSQDASRAALEVADDMTMLGPHGRPGDQWLAAMKWGWLMYDW